MSCELYMLRTCGPNGEAHGGFRWPLNIGSEVIAPDWDPRPVCGGGLHGLLLGEGDWDLLDTMSRDSVFLVCAVREDDVVWIDNDKIKTQRCRVVYAGERRGALDLIGGPLGHEGLPFGCVTAGDEGTATVGDYGIATVGGGGTARAGDYGIATAGDRGASIAGYGGTATAGNVGTATVGYWGTATVGDGGTATAGDYGIATAGDRGASIAGYGGTATAGNGGTATVGYWGTATAGDEGILQIWHYDGRPRLATAYVGENGILPNTPYRYVDGQFEQTDNRDE